MTHTQILEALHAEDPTPLYQQADNLRREHMGDGIKLRGLVELSSVCVRNCTYCGLRVGNPHVVRYTLTTEELITCAQQAQALHLGTVVLQAGESTSNIPASWIAEVIRRIRGETGQRITLSLGERSPDEFALWREAGAERYLLRFETSNLPLFASIHPGVDPHKEHPRLQRLRILKSLGYEVGGGVMIGIPGQSYDMLVEDILTFNRLHLDMIGLGPYIPHPDTPLYHVPNLPEAKQVPATADMACRTLALARILNPHANIPSTTALSSIDPLSGRRKGLTCGANVFMPNLTPTQYRKAYALYPGKICVNIPDADDMTHLLADFSHLNRFHLHDA